MTIRKFASDGSVVEFESAQMELPGSTNPVDIPILLDTPEQKYEGTWEPGIDHPTIPSFKSGPYAGIILYVPIPEDQIKR